MFIKHGGISHLNPIITYFINRELNILYHLGTRVNTQDHSGANAIFFPGEGWMIVFNTFAYMHLND